MLRATSPRRPAKPLLLHLTYYTKNGLVRTREGFALSPKRTHRVAIRPGADDVYVEVEVQNTDKKALRFQTLAITGQPVPLTPKEPTPHTALQEAPPCTDCPPCEGCTVLPEVVVTAPSLSSSFWNDFVRVLWGSSDNGGYSVTALTGTSGGGGGINGGYVVNVNGQNHYVEVNPPQSGVDNEKEVDTRANRCDGLIKMNQLSFTSSMTRESFAVVTSDGKFHILPMKNASSDGLSFNVPAHWRTGTDGKVTVGFIDGNGQTVYINDVIATYHTHPMCISFNECGSQPSTYATNSGGNDQAVAELTIPHSVQNYIVSCCGITQYGYSNGNWAVSPVMSWSQATTVTEFRNRIFNTLCIE